MGFYLHLPPPSFALLDFPQRPFLASLFGPGIALALLAVALLFSAWKTNQRLRKKLAASAASERRHRSLVEASTNCVQILDLEGRCVSVNDHGVELLGHTRNEIVGQKFIDRWPPLMRPAIAAALDRAIQGEATTLDAIYQREQDERAFNVALKPVFDARRQVEHIACIAVDITEQKRTEREVFAAKNTAEAATRAKSEFLAIVSHELRTPLGGIIGILELLKKSAQAPQQQHYLTLAHDNAELLLELLNELLDAAKIEAGRLVLEAIPFEPRVELSRVVDCLRARAVAKDLELTCSFADDIPQFLQGDPTRLRQALANLVSNAIKFTADGSVKVDVSCAPSVESGQRGLCIKVVDTGEGISEEAQTRLFSKFEQGDSTTSRCYGGSGLGLAIVKQIAELMLGNVTVNSVPGKGTTFQFSAQFHLPAPDVIEAVTLRARTCILTHHSHRLRVLCADDEPINRIIAEGLVTGLGHLIEFAVDGEDALEKLSLGDFDLVLMDSRMPRMDGIQATRLIRDRSTTVRDHGIFIVATTADTTSSHRERCFNAGMNRFLVKPFRESDLSALIKEVIECQLARGHSLEPMQRMRPQESPTPLEAPSGLSESEILAMIDSSAAPAVPTRSPPSPQVIMQYLCDAPERFAQMRAALRDQDNVALGLAAHSIKSISYYVAAESLSVLGKKIETAADSGQLAEAAALVEAAEFEFTEVRKKLTRSSRIPHETTAG